MLSIVRLWLPVSLMVIGVVIVVIGGASEGALVIGIPVFSAGASVLFLNGLFRLGVSGDHERDHEAAAREHFAAHGRWPGENGASR